MGFFTTRPRGSSSGAFCVSYPESNLICKLELNTAILDFGRFEVSKNSIFHKSSRKPQMVRYGESRVTCKFELNTAILDFH